MEKSPKDISSQIISRGNFISLPRGFFDQDTNFKKESFIKDLLFSKLEDLKYSLKLAEYNFAYGLYSIAN